MKKLLIILAFLPIGLFGQSNWAAVNLGTTEMSRIYYGETLVWEKPSGGDSILICGEYYPYDSIGSQVWLTKNLHCNDSEGGIYSYDDNTANSDIYGYMYTYDAAMRIDTSIEGWHVPSLEEFTTLETYLGGSTVAGGKLKEEGTTHWLTPNTGATNESGFTALPGGLFYYGEFYANINGASYFISSTPGIPESESFYATPYHLIIYYDESATYIGSFTDLSVDELDFRFSLRLIKD